MRPEPKEKLDLRALKLWQIHGGIGTAILSIIVFGAAAALIILLEWSHWILIIPAVLVILHGILEILVLPQLRWQRWRYEITENEIDLQRGVWIVERTLIPLARVQHVDTLQGILMRHYDLATVTISTATGAHEIPALATETASALSQHISSLAQVSDDVL